MYNFMLVWRTRISHKWISFISNCYLKNSARSQKCEIFTWANDIVCNIWRQQKRRGEKTPRWQKTESKYLKFSNMKHEKSEQSHSQSRVYLSIATIIIIIIMWTFNGQCFKANIGTDTGTHAYIFFLCPLPKTSFFLNNYLLIFN